MTNPEHGLRWLNQNFGTQLAQATAKTPIPPALLMAIAWQETGLLWGKWISAKSPEDILALCVGDTLDAPRRSAFPRSRTELEAWPQGKPMFEVARAALVQVGKADASYASAARNPNKFCHGFGMFQLDIQAFRTNPDYFLKRTWARAPAPWLPRSCGQRWLFCLAQAKRGSARANASTSPSLTIRATPTCGWVYTSASSRASRIQAAFIMANISLHCCLCAKKSGQSSL
jgi:hypothetical protein